MNEAGTDSIRSSPSDDAPTSDSGRPTSPVLSVRGAEHTLSSAETLKLFINNGLPRSSRSIERYCSSGRLDCFLDPDDKRYYATPASVELLIGHIKELQRRHEQAANVGHIPTAHTANVGHIPTAHTANVGHIPTIDADLSHAGGNSITALEAKISRLETESSVNKLYIEKLHEERVKDRDRFIELGNIIGTLETEIKQIAAPKGERVTEEQDGDFSNELAQEAAQVVPVNES